METRILVVDIQGKKFGYTEEMLKANDWSLAEGSTTDYTKADSRISGVWCPLSTKLQWLDGDNQAVEDAITDKAAPFIRHGERWEAQVVDRAIVQWGFEAADPNWIRGQAGLAKMPRKLSQLIKALVVAEMYGDTDDPLSQAPSLPN